MTGRLLMAALLVAASTGAAGTSAVVHGTIATVVVDRVPQSTRVPRPRPPKLLAPSGSTLTLGVPGDLVRLSADGGIVAAGYADYSNPDLDTCRYVALWDTRSASIVRATLDDDCDAQIFEHLTLAGDRVAWVDTYLSNFGPYCYVRTATLAKPEVADVWDCDQDPISGEGRGVFIDRMYKNRGLVQFDFSVDTRCEGFPNCSKLQPGSRAISARGKLIAAPRGPRVGPPSSVGGITVSEAGNAIKLHRSGRDRTITPTGKLVWTQLTRAGLFYAYRTKDKLFPGRVAFLSLAAVLKLFG